MNLLATLFALAASQGAKNICESSLPGDFEHLALLEIGTRWSCSCKMNNNKFCPSDSVIDFNSIPEYIILNTITGTDKHDGTELQATR